MVTKQSAQRMWEAALGRLELQVTRPSFDTWLRGTVGISVQGDTLLVGVPTPFAAEWLEQRMQGLIETAVAAVAAGPLGVTFSVRGAAPPPGLSPPQAPIADGPFKRPVSLAQLNDRYTFDSFIVGPSNQLAYAASVAVANAPGQAYNPVFLYSSVGLGKTHLLHAIGLHAQAAGKSVAFVTCEQFTIEYLAAIRDRRTDGFRDRYRGVDVLLIDDIQFLSGKEGTQDGFFHTFNALHDARRQIVLTSDRPPAALPLLEDRLRSRFEWGLVADIGSPDLETRIAILQAHAATTTVPVPDEVLAFIAERVQTNVRRLEGCLNHVTAMAQFTNQAVTIALATNSLSATAATAAGLSSPKAIIAAVAAHYGLSTGALVGGRRDKATATARQVAMYLAHDVLRSTPDEIGQTLGGRDRTTVLYSIKKVLSRSNLDPDFASTLRHLKASISEQPIEE
jgi:chromosomal replication initiator protein